MHNLLIASSFVATLIIPCLFAAFPGKNEIPTTINALWPGPLAQDRSLDVRYGREVDNCIARKTVVQGSSLTYHGL